MPEDQILMIIKFISDRIIYSNQDFVHLKIWITFYVSAVRNQEYTPLSATQSLLNKLSFLTNDCFKIFLNEKTSLKEQTVDLYEKDVGYILEEFEEHFYKVLLPAEPEVDGEVMMSS